jgi:hypothetical protein
MSSEYDSDDEDQFLFKRSDAVGVSMGTKLVVRGVVRKAKETVEEAAEKKREAKQRKERELREAGFVLRGHGYDRSDNIKSSQIRSFQGGVQSNSSHIQISSGMQTESQRYAQTQKQYTDRTTELPKVQVAVSVGFQNAFEDEASSGEEEALLVEESPAKGNGALPLSPEAIYEEESAGEPVILEEIVKDSPRLSPRLARMQGGILSLLINDMGSKLQTQTHIEIQMTQMPSTIRCRSVFFR